ncbi:ABC-2 type transport system permease protein [Gammaproteobacteria bacterium]
MKPRFLYLLLFLALMCLWIGSAGAEETAPPPPALDAPAVPTDEQILVSLQEQTQAALQAKDWTKALELTDRLLERQPDNANPHWWRGITFSQLGRQEEAMSSYQRVTVLAPGFADVWISLCWAQIESNRLTDARTSCEKAVALAPESMAAVINLGHTYLLQGDRETAHAWYQKTIPLIPDDAALKSGPLADFDLFIERGWQVEASRKERAWVAQAYADWKRAEELNHQVLAGYQDGRYAQAISLAEESLTLARTVLGGFNPKVATRLNKLATLLEKTGRYEEAVPLYCEALAINSVLEYGYIFVIGSILIWLSLLILLLWKALAQGKFMQRPMRGIMLSSLSVWAIPVVVAYGAWSETMPYLLTMAIGGLITVVWNSLWALRWFHLGVVERGTLVGHSTLGLAVAATAWMIHQHSTWLGMPSPSAGQCVALLLLALPLAAYLSVVWRSHSSGATLALVGLGMLVILLLAIAFEGWGLQFNYPYYSFDGFASGMLVGTTLALLGFRFFLNGAKERTLLRGKSLVTVASYGAMCLLLLLLFILFYPEALWFFGLTGTAFTLWLILYPIRQAWLRWLTGIAGLVGMAVLAWQGPEYRSHNILIFLYYGLINEVWLTSSILLFFSGGLIFLGRGVRRLYKHWRHFGFTQDELVTPWVLVAVAPVVVFAWMCLDADYNVDLADNQQQAVTAQEVILNTVKTYRQPWVHYLKILPKGHPAIAYILDAVADSLKSAWRYSEAETIYWEALAIRRKALPEVHPDIAISLIKLGEMLYATGRYGETELFYREALAIQKKALPEGHPDIASNLSNLALLLKTTGRYGEAEPFYREALAIARKENRFALSTLRFLESMAGFQMNQDISTKLNNLAGLLMTTGRYGEAESLLREALAISKKDLPEGHPDIATSLNNLAALLQDTGRYGEAEPLYREALAITQKVLCKVHPHIATNLTNLAVLLHNTGRYGEAETLYREALAIKKKALPEGHPDIAISLNNLAGLLDTTGRYGEAEPLYREALRIAKGGGSPETLWNVQGNLRAFYAKQDQRPLAIFFGKQAVNTIQSIRQNLKSSEQATQQAFLKSKESYYKDLADLLIAEGRLPEAQQVLEMLKEQEYFDFVRRDAQTDSRQTQASINPFEAEQFQAYESGSRDLARLGAEYQALIRIEETASLSAGQQARLQELRPQIDAAAARFNTVVDGIVAAFRNLSAERLAELTERQINSDDRGLVRDLGDDVALLHTLVMDDKLHLLLTLPQALLAKVSPVGVAEVNRQVAALREALQDRRRDPRPVAQALYKTLIEPVAADLETAHVKTLMVSLDGSLRYIPLAALYDGEHYLAERYALSVFTAAARDKVRGSPKPKWTVSGFGVSQPHENFSALTSVPGELTAIVRATPDEAGVLPGQRQLDVAFTEDHLRDGLRRPVVHIASHFSLQPGNESMSFLLLGDGSHLPLHQIRAGYDFGSVDLLTLSACQTAVGGQNAKGQEVEGLGTLAQKKGAKGVIATLWPVDDASTGLFMQHFYQLRQEKHLTKAEALRQAQLTLLRGDNTTASPAVAETGRGEVIRVGKAGENSAPAFFADPAHPYAHSYYWAPFILMGNWL